jgi:hypothetical protein
MKPGSAVPLLLLAVLTPSALCVEQGSPVTKVQQLLADLEAKVNRQGAEAKKLYEDFTEWCETHSKDLKYAIKTGKAQIEDLKATISQESSDSQALTAKVEELGSSISGDESDLKAATEIREKAAAEFVAERKEMVETISALERAIGILEREMRKGGAMLQLQGSKGVLQALTTLVKAQELSSSDASTLTSLVQSSDSDDDAELGAPDPSAYKGHSGGIVETLENLLEKARNQLEASEKKEVNEQHNFGMLKQSLSDEIKYASKDMSEAKKALATSSETKATAEGDLAVTTKDLEADEEGLETMKVDCMQRGQDYETETKSRAEELNAIAQARKAIAESVSGAAEQTYSFSQLSAPSFFQGAIEKNSRLSTGADLANFEAVQFVRNLARQQNDDALMQLAMRMASVMRFGSAGGADPFQKVKALIVDMIERLQKDSQQDASHKAYCDKETGETKAKKQEKEAEVDKLTTKIDSMKAKSAQLKEEVAGLQKDLAEIASSNAEATSLRRGEKKQYTTNRKEMEDGIEGVKLALNILRDYYAKDGGHAKAEGAASGIIGMLEVVEADFSKGLSEMNVAEAAAAAEYKKMMQKNEIEQATKESSVKYKSKEATGLTRSVAETTSDLQGTKTELSAVTEYLGKIDAMCVAKPETYSSRKSRREAEIAGLKEALQILSGEAVFLQRVGRGALRGVHHHA